MTFTTVPDNSLVYQLYSLTDAEIKVVEGS
jgi:hypothetical protein